MGLGVGVLLAYIVLLLPLLWFLDVIISVIIIEC